MSEETVKNVEKDTKLENLLDEKIGQQEGLSELVEIQSRLNRWKKVLEDCSSYEEFEKIFVSDEVLTVYQAVGVLTKAILKECCHSKAGARYVLDAEKQMLYKLSRQVQESKVYEIFFDKA